MGWKQSVGEYSGWLNEDGVYYRTTDWLVTTGDGMLAVLEKMHGQGFAWDLSSDWCDTADKRTFAVFSKQRIYEVARQDSVPLAAGRAAKAALEVTLLDVVAART